MVTGGNVTGLTDDLEKAGLVSREVSADDRRSYIIRLTPSGRKKFEQVASIHEDWVIEFFAGLKASERDQLNGLLGRLRIHLAQTLNKAPVTSAAPTPRKARAPRRQRTG